MATPRPAKKRKTSQQPLDPLPLPTAPPLKSPPLPLASTTTDASTRAEPSLALEGAAEAVEDEVEAKEPTEEELAERRRVFDVVAEDYHDIITELPLEYARTFALVRELEDAQQGYTGLLRTTFESYLSSLRAPATSTAPPPAPPPALHLLSQNANAAIRAGEDKLGLAISLYESVDRHIRRLDADLAKYEDSIVIGLREGTLPSHDAPAAGDKSPPGATTSLGAQLMGLHEGFEDEEEEEGAAGGVAGAGLGRKKKGKGLSAAEREKEGEWKRRREAQKLEKKKEKEREKGKGLGAAVEQAHKPIAVVPIGMPIDPNEPVYCFCQRVAFGEMIACENEDCPREWFHYDCVNLEKAPEGEWYCDPCIELLNVDPVTMKPR